MYTCITEKLQKTKKKILKLFKEKKWITYKGMKRLSTDISTTMEASEQGKKIFTELTVKICEPRINYTA